MNDDLKQTLDELEALSESMRLQLEGADKCAAALMQWFEDGKSLQTQVGDLADTFRHTLERWELVRDALLDRIKRDGEDDAADYWKDA